MQWKRNAGMKFELTSTVSKHCFFKYSLEFDDFYNWTGAPAKLIVLTWYISPHAPVIAE